jgi:MinD-like ATPase involved in chromosome partitioning or flagellar assembly
MGTIITFYSFKGGVGRTMALANVAVLLAISGRRVLTVDWDLEAPGLQRYFPTSPQPDGTRVGILDLLTSANASGGGASVAETWERYLTPARVPGINADSLHLLAAGTEDDELYFRQLQKLDWPRFYAERSAGAFLERLREEWKGAYDFVLIDSRTGFTDSGGVCTVQMPDVLTAIFTTNDQSIIGTKRAVERAQRGRQRLAYDRMPLIVLPLLSRFDGRVERDEANMWLDKASDEMAEYLDSWLRTGTSHRQVMERIKIPHVPKYSFGEKLPVLTDSLTDPDGIGYVLDTITKLISSEFEAADEGLLGTETYSASAALERLNYLFEDLEERLLAKARHGRLRLIARMTITALVLVGVVGLVLYGPSQPGWLTAALAAVAGGLIPLAYRSVDSVRDIRVMRELAAKARKMRALYGDSPERLRRSYEDLEREAASSLGEGSQQSAFSGSAGAR